MPYSLETARPPASGEKRRLPRMQPCNYKKVTAIQAAANTERTQ